MDKQTTEPVLNVETPENGIALVRLNRPSVRNALNLELRHALSRCFQDLGDDQNVRCIVLTGDEKAFCAGADLNEYIDATAIEIQDRNLLKLWGSIAHCPKPIIAAVNGYAIGGGCELAMHADIVIAGQNARFSQPEIKIGIIPGGGATQRLVRAIGKSNAMKMLLTGEFITAQEAKDMLLISDVVSDEDVLHAALELAVSISSMPTLGSKQIKELVIESMNTSLETGLREEIRAFQMMFNAPDKTERMGKIIQKK